MALLENLLTGKWLNYDRHTTSDGTPVTNNRVSHHHATQQEIDR